jgi:hypothetical protein
VVAKPIQLLGVLDQNKALKTGKEAALSAMRHSARRV